jgi:hypothetical protein
MTEPVRSKEAQGIRQLSFSDVELEWFKMPWLEVADRDRPFVKRGTVDLDPVGGPVTTTTISLGGLDRLYIRIDEVDLVPLDPFSLQNSEVLQRISTRKPLNHWRQFDQTVSPGPAYESEFAVNRLFTVPPGETFDIIFTSLSPLGRTRWDFEIRGNLSRIAN